MPGIRKKWVSWEELDDLGLSPYSIVDYSRISGLTPGSVPFADADGMLDEDNANIIWDYVNDFLGIHETTPMALVHINSVGGSIPCLNLEAGAEGELVTPDGQSLRIGHWNGVDTFTERLKIDDAGKFYISYMSAGSVGFFGAGGEEKQDNDNFFWDAVNKRLGLNLGGGAPNETLELDGKLRLNGADYSTISNNTNANREILQLRAVSLLANGAGINLYGGADSTFPDMIKMWTNNVEALSIDAAQLVTIDDLSISNPANIYALSHDLFADYLAAEHKSLPNTIAEVLSDHDKAAHDALAIDHGSLTGLADVGDHNWSATKTTVVWNKSIGAGGDYPTWAAMIAAMPDLLDHAAIVTIEAGTTLSEICNLYNKHGTSLATLTFKAEKYYPTSGVLPTADSATATTLRDAELAAAALGDDYFNGCWIHVVDGTGTDNGYVPITDYIDATGDVVVAAWPGTQPDNTSRYEIVGALVDSGGENFSFLVQNNTIAIYFYGIGVKDSDQWGWYLRNNVFVWLEYCGAYNCGRDGIACEGSLNIYNWYCGVVKCNTANHGSSGGIYIGTTNNVYVYKCGISDNLQRGVLAENGGYAYADNNFGDLNGNWGIYAQNGIQVNIVGVECSGAAGNHSDPGTAGAANADQAAAY